jgi:uncharacterized protein YecE (DUF72 family)
MIYPIRVGVGGWSFEPWEETFYPHGLPKTRQLEYMSHRFTAVEVNATYYSSFKPQTFAKWRETAPESFRFSLKAHRYETVRKTREDMQTSVRLFLEQGIVELKEKLGPINWQFPPTRKFDPEHMEMFLALLPNELGGLPLRHVLEVRHPSFDDPAFLDLLSKYRASVVHAEADDFPLIRHEGGDFAVARLMQSSAEEPAGYGAKAIARLAKQFSDWARRQEVYVFFIAGAKEKNPAAALTLQEKLGIKPTLEAGGLPPAVRGKATKAPAKKKPARK